ncbi:MAG: hypothetical protein WDN72_03125 [Alphaproteobacteria bacterium]
MTNVSDLSYTYAVNQASTTIDYNPGDGTWNGQGEVADSNHVLHDFTFFNPSTKSSLTAAEIAQVSTAESLWTRLISSTAFGNAPAATALHI